MCDSIPQHMVTCMLRTYQKTRHALSHNLLASVMSYLMDVNLLEGSSLHQRMWFPWDCGKNNLSALALAEKEQCWEERSQTVPRRVPVPVVPFVGSVLLSLQCVGAGATCRHNLSFAVL